MDDEIKAAFDEMQEQIRKQNIERDKAVEKARTKIAASETSQNYQKMRMQRSTDDTQEGLSMMQRFARRLGR